MKRELRTVISLLLVLFVSKCFSQSSYPAFQIAVDYGRFRGDSSRAYVELCYSFPEKQLSYIREGEIYRGEILFDVMITPEEQADSVVRRAWLTPHEVTDTASLVDNKSLVGVVGFGLQPGKYSINFFAQDINDKVRVDSTEFSLEVQLFENPDQVMVSDVQLCSNIRQSNDRQSFFYKNTLEVIPNPAGLYGVSKPILFYYAEVYNLLRGIQSEKFIVRTTVYDASGNVVISRERKKSRANESSVEVGTLRVGSLKQGSYTLVFSVVDSSAQTSISSMKRFFVYNPGSVEEETASSAGADLLASEYAMMSESQLDLEFSQCQYLRKKVEQDQYKALKGVEAKRKFLYEFWKKRDPIPQTAVNEAKREYFKRVSDANSTFRSSFRDGWKTDRGRVYIIYGSPDEYNRFPSETGLFPYEIWNYYNIQGGVEFVFIDRTGFQDYQLVHSTHRNELRDRQWRDKVQR